MRVKNLSVLEALKYKKNEIFCLIKLCPRYIKYFHGQVKPHKTYHWMEAEHWASFDSGLEKILDEHIAEFSEQNISEEAVGKSFQLSPLISVRVCVSRIPIATLCLCAYGSNVSAKDVTLALECHVEYCDEKYFTDTPDSRSLKVEDIEDSHEYELQVLSFQSETDGCLNERAISPPLYTPSPKKNTNGTEIIGLNIDEERYSPKPIDDTVNYVTSKFEVPTYSPTRIKRKEKTTNDVKTCDEKNEQICSSSHEENQITDKKCRRGISPKEQKLEDDPEQKVMVISNDKNLKSVKKDKNDDNIDVFSSTQSGEKCKRNPKNYNDNIPALGPRRSSRSPIKSKRLVESMERIQKKKTTKSQIVKTLNKNENLFGSDDEDFVTKTTETRTANKPHTTITKSSVQKRKHEQTSSCEQEKQCMTTWLGKKRDEKLVMESNPKKHKPRRIDSPIPNRDSALNNISMAQLDEQIRKEKIETEYNRKLKKVLEEMVQPDPEAVEILSLHDMSKNEILETFTQHKPVLDEVFEKSHKKANVHGNDGIDHYTVMRLIDHSKQLDMMNKLSEIYESHDEGPSAYAKLYANAILPEWIIGIFMDKYNFTRDKAIQQVKAQESYKLHLAAKSNDVIEFE